MQSGLGRTFPAMACLALLLGLALVVTGCGARAIPSGWREFRASTGLRLAYPPGWTAGEAHHSGGDFVKIDGGDVGSITIVASQATAESRDLDGWTSRTIRLLERTGRVSGPVRVTVGGKPSSQFAFENSAGAMRTTIVVDGSETYSIFATYGSNADAKARLDDAYDELLSTIVFGKQVVWKSELNA